MQAHLSKERLWILSDLTKTRKENGQKALISLADSGG
jgi:hypothetical protein